MEFHAFIRRLSASKPFKYRAEMPVLKTPFGLTVGSLDVFYHAKGLALSSLRRVSGRQPLDLASLKLVPRHEVLAGWLGK